MFWGWKNQYCQNAGTTQGSLLIQCISSQITNDIFHRAGTKKLKLVWKLKNPEQSILRKNKTGGIILPDFRLYYKASVIKTVWLLPQKQIHRSVEQDSKPRYKPINLWVINLQQRRKEYAMEKRQSNKCAGKTGQVHVEEVQNTLLTLYTKINSKWIKDLNVKTGY